MNQAQAKPLHLALVHPKTGDLVFKGAALPYKPPIDKILALTILNNINDTFLESIEYWKRNECAPEQFAHWRDAQIYPIDIGDRKYHAAGVASATEFLVKEFGLELTTGFAKLIEMIARNNINGYLKKMPFAIPAILRQMYELSNADSFHMLIIRNVMDVIEAHVSVADGKIARSEEGLNEALPELVEHFSICNYQPLTLGGYLRNLWLLGVETAVIVEKVAFWSNGKTESEARLAFGKEKFDALPVRDWFKAGSFKGIVVKTDDRFLADAAIRSREYQIRIIVGSDGHTVISSNASSGVRLGQIAEALAAQEPGRWYFQEQMGALINGGPQYVGVESTKLSSARIVGLLQKHLNPKAK